MLKYVGKDITSQLDPRQKACLNNFYQAINDGALTYADRFCLCGSKNSFDTCIENDRYGVLSPVSVCKDCSLPYVSKFLDNASLVEFYKSYYRPMYSESYRTPEFMYDSQVSKGKSYQSYLADIGIVMSGSKVVDIGCGPGGVLVAFNENNNECFGCDFDTDFMKYGIEKGREIYFGDFFDIKKSQNVDLAIMSHVLEHITDPIDYLYQLHGRLNNDGLLLIEVPGLKHLHEGVISRFFQGVHLYTFYEEYLKIIVESLGYKVISSNEDIVMLCIKSRTPDLPHKVKEKLKKLTHRAESNQSYINKTVKYYNIGLNPWMYKRFLRKFIISLMDFFKIKDFAKKILNK